MDLLIAVILIGFTIVFDLIAIRYRAYLFSTIGGTVMLSGLSVLLNDHQIVLRTAFNSATNTFYSNLGSSSDYQTIIIVFITFTVMSAYLTLAIHKVA